MDRVDRVDGVDHTAGEESPHGPHNPNRVVDKNCLDCVALFFQVVMSYINTLTFKDMPCLD